MFQKIKRKAEDLKKIAEDKSKNFDLSNIKNSIEKSKDAIIDGATKASGMAKDIRTTAKSAISESAEKASNVADEFENKTRSIFDNATQKTTAAIADAKTATKLAIVSSKESAHAMHLKYGPTVEKIVVNGLIGIAEEKLQDEIFLKSSLAKIYELLPTPFRMAIDRDAFIGFCMDNKEPIAMKIQGYKKQTEENSQPKIENNPNISH